MPDVRTGPRPPIKPLRWRRASRGRWLGLHPDRHWHLYDKCSCCGRRKRITAKKCFECRFRTRRITRWRKKGDRHWVGYNRCPGGCGGLKRANPKKHAVHRLHRRVRQLGLGHQLEDVVRAVRRRKRCTICGRTARQAGNGKKSLHIDHDHRRRTFRGLICGPCNVGLGQFGDDPKRLRRAADYLLKHRSAPSKKNPSLAKSTKGP